MEENTKIRVRFEIGEIKFEAEGPADLVERERSVFTNTLLPSAVEAIVRTRGAEQAMKYIEPVEQPKVLPSSNATPSSESATPHILPNLGKLENKILRLYRRIMMKKRMVIHLLHLIM